MFYIGQPIVQKYNGSIIHDVISVKYNKKNEIFDCFPRLNKKVYKQKKRTHQIELTLLQDKHFILKWSLLINNFVGHKYWIDTCDVRILYWECTNSTLSSILLESIWVYRVLACLFLLKVSSLRNIFRTQLFFLIWILEIT